MVNYKKILLVDDDVDDRQIFEQILLEADARILLECAGNGLGMVTLLDHTPDDALPDLIILDQNMPKMSGKESLLFLKDSTRYRHIPVIVYSTYQIEDFYLECLRLGAQDVVAKPDTIQSYRDMIDHFLHSTPSTG
jgi:CheY-like chemotaxis protein